MSVKHRARLVDPDGFDSFDIKASQGGIGIDYVYGVKGAERTLFAVDFDGEVIEATAAQAWLSHRKMTAAEFVADAGPDVQAAWVASSHDSGWDADDSSRKADAATRDADMPAEHHQETKHATAAAAHRRAASDHEKTAALHDTEGREAAAAGDSNTANDHKRQADESRAKQDKHEKQAGAHDRKLKKIRQSATSDADNDGDAKKDDDSDEDGVKAGQVPDATPDPATPAADRVEVKLQAMADHYGISVDQVRATIMGVVPVGAGDVHAMNPYHEGGTGRFTSGAGGAKKLQDQGANSASEVAAAASKSAHTFTGSHAAATQANLAAADVAEKVRQRSKAAFAGAVARGDSLAAVAHANEASNAEHNVNLHQRIAMEHGNQAEREAAHAINTGLAAALPKPPASPVAAPKSSLVVRALAAVGRGTGTAVKYTGAAVAVGGVASTPLTGAIGLAVGAAGVGVATMGHGVNRLFGGGKKAPPPASAPPAAGAPGAPTSPGAAAPTAAPARGNPITDAIADVEQHAANRANQAGKGFIDRMFNGKKKGVTLTYGGQSSGNSATPPPPAAAQRGSSANPYPATVVPEESARSKSFGSRMTAAGDAARNSGGSSSESSSPSPARDFGDTAAAIDRANRASRMAAGTNSQSGNAPSGRSFSDTLGAINRSNVSNRTPVDAIVLPSPPTASSRGAATPPAVPTPSYTFNSQPASGQLSHSLSQLRQHYAPPVRSRTATGETRPPSKQLPHKPWEVAEAAEAKRAGNIAAIANAIAAVRTKTE